MKDRTWNKIIFVIMTIVIGYFAISVAKADGNEELIVQLENSIAKCAAAHGIVGMMLKNEYYMQEGKRWTEYLIGFTEYNKGKTYELVKTHMANGLANLDAGNATLDQFREFTDVGCIKLRDTLLEYTDSSIDDWIEE